MLGLFLVYKISFIFLSYYKLRIDYMLGFLYNYLKFLYKFIKVCVIIFNLYKRKLRFREVE